MGVVAMALPARRKSTTSAMKVMKSKRLSKIAHGKLARALVLRGSKAKTASGLTSSMLMKNKRGKIVSKRQSAEGKRRYAQIAPWVEALKKARHALKLEGFVPINGRTAQGKAFYS